jgi:hypothetical protein
MSKDVVLTNNIRVCFLTIDYNKFISILMVPNDVIDTIGHLFDDIEDLCSRR